MDAGDAEGKRKQVSSEQLTALLEFLKEHKELAKGENRGRRRRGNSQSAKVWTLCAKQLNAVEDGASKDGKGWSKYWCDWKYRVKRHALELKLALDNDRTQLPVGLEPLTPMEENILNIIGVHEIQGVIISKSYYEGVNEDELLYTETNDDNILNEYFEEVIASKNPSSANGHNSPQSSGDDSAGPSNPTVSKPTIDAAQRKKVSKKRCSSGGTGTTGSGRTSKRSKKEQSSTNKTAQRHPSSKNKSGPPSASIPSMPLEDKPEVGTSINGNRIDPDGEDKASMFLSIEREKVSLIGNVVKSLDSINSELSRLVSVMSDIKDCMNRNAESLNKTVTNI